MTPAPKCERCDGDGWVEIFGDEGYPVGATCCERCSGSGRKNNSWMAALTDPDVLRER